MVIHAKKSPLQVECKMVGTGRVTSELTSACASLRLSSIRCVVDSATSRSVSLLASESVAVLSCAKRMAFRVSRSSRAALCPAISASASLSCAERRPLRFSRSSRAVVAESAAAAAAAAATAAASASAAA